MNDKPDWRNPMGIQGPSPATRYVQPGAEKMEHVADEAPPEQSDNEPEEESDQEE